MSSWVNMLVISIYDLSCDAGINVSPSLTLELVNVCLLCA